jgi:hypothetical protein
MLRDHVTVNSVSVNQTNGINSDACKYKSRKFCHYNSAELLVSKEESAPLN